MKIRPGFVSNSSTSSFCIIGVSEGSSLQTLIDAEKKDFVNDKDYLGNGIDEGKVVNFYGYENNPYYAGVPAEEFLNIMSIPMACNAFQQLIMEKFGIDIPIEDISFYYGECGG